MRQLFAVRHLIVVLVGFLLLFGVLFVTKYPAHAQSIDGGVSLQFDPQFPTPGSTVTVSLDAYSMDTLGAGITWYADKKELASFKNERSITLSVGEAGKAQSVQAVISKAGFAPVVVSGVVIPSVVDIVIESQTYVPNFYHGRALPSDGATVRAVAVVDTGGKDSRALSYTWSFNGSVLLGGSVLGKQAIEFTMPEYKNNTLEVSVADERGVVVGDKIIGLNPYEPELHFYESVPLRGENGRSVKDPFVLTGDETTLVAEPYFMSPNFKDLSFGWKINGQEVTPNKDQHSITVRRVGTSGQSTLSVEISAQNDLIQYVEKSVGLLF